MNAEEALARKPWLLPFLYAIWRGVEARAGSLSKALGVKRQVVKAALRELRALGALDGYRLNRELAEWLERQAMVVKGRKAVWLKGQVYVLAVVKRSRVSVYTVPAKLVEKMEGILKTGGELSATDAALSLGCSPLAASRALQVLLILGKAERAGRLYRYAYSEGGGVLSSAL